jgi:hypothetical protein
MTTSTGIFSGNIAIDALAYSSWNADPHTAATITYTFLQTVPSNATTEDQTGFLPLTEAQKAAVRTALAQWSAVANITFVEINDPDGSSGQIRFGTNDQTAARSAGYSDLPDANFGTQVNTYFNNHDGNNSRFVPGSYGVTTFIHEIGHAIGLKHPGNYNGQDGSGTPPYLPAETDNTDYSIMSYNDGASANLNGRYSSTPMLYDIQAIQYLYGVNTSWHTGNDTYVFGEASAPQSIWDAGGVNTFDFSSTTRGATIDLHAGAFSSSAPNLHNISIAYNVLIQNAIGGFGNDRITANDGTNTINAGAGDDFVQTGAGIDSIDGGTGSDTVAFSSAQAAYSIARSSAGFTISNRTNSGNVVSVANVEFLSFADGIVNTQSIGAGTRPSVAHALADVYAGVGKAFSLQVAGDAFLDPDVGDSLHYSATLANGQALPNWLHFDAATRTFSGTPGNGQAGNTTVRVTATDNTNLSATSDFHISTLINYGQHFTATTANDTFNGTGAIDDVTFSGNRANFTIVSNGNHTFTVSQANGSIDTLFNIDRIRFDDASIALDIDGHGGQAYGLYQAVFNRLPDAGGLGYWVNALDTGAALIDVTNTFISSPEFVATYSSLGTNDFVKLLYVNILHRTAEAGGLTYWTGVLDSGATDRANVVLNFSASAEFQGNLVQAVGNGFSYTPFLG